MTMPANDAVVTYDLRQREVNELLGVIKKLRDVREAHGSTAFFDRHWTALDEMPTALRRFFDRFRRTEGSAAVLVRGFPVDDEAIGATPPHWETTANSARTADYEIYLGLCAMALGEPFTWATLQAGRIVQNILPIAGDELRQNGYGSEALLEFHTEDGFHPDRCDYLLLFGLRNYAQVPTMIAAVRDVELSAADRAILAQPRFFILPDDEHIRQLQSRDPNHPALAVMQRMRDFPEPTAVLSGDPARPYLCIDRPFMSCVGDDLVAMRALDRLMAELERVQRDIVVGPGTLLVVDNYAAVHGRRAFSSRHDGTDRWLKKMTVRRDLRRATMSVAHSDHRVLI